MTKVVLDAFGGDHSPEEIVKGAVMALKKYDELNIILTGDQERLEALLESEDKNIREKIEIIDAKEIILNEEAPTVAIRTKRDSSLVKAFDAVRTNEEVAGFVGAGSTGAVLTGAFLKLGRIKGISRPALCPILPTKKGTNVAIIDCGANMDAKPINLVHFALMGTAYLKSVYGIENPRVALLNVGVEEHKGNDLSKEAFELLSRLEGINFVGNMEARELLSGDYDLVVTDGFAGNVLLKSTEGAILSVLSMLKDEIKDGVMSKIGALLMKRVFKNLKAKLDYSKQGGAVLLGCKKLIVKSHGSSKAESICASIKQVIDMDKAKLVDLISDYVGKYDIEIEDKVE